MSTVVIWSKSKPEVECQYGARLSGFNVMIPEPHATLQDERIPSAILKIVFRRILFFCFLNAVWALVSCGFRIVFDTLVYIHVM